MRPVWITAVCLAVSLTVTSIIFYRPVESSLLPSNIWLLTLVNVNVILVVVLLLLLSRNLVKLYFERRHKLLGAGFRAKLVAAFVGLTLIPTFLLFIVASGLISSSIENWFGIQVEQSLKNSLEIARGYYEATRTRAAELGRAIALESAREAPDPIAQQQMLERVMGKPTARLGVSGISLYARGGAPVARWTLGTRNGDHSSGGGGAPHRPDAALLGQLLAEAAGGKEADATFSDESGDLLRVAIPIRNAAPAHAAAPVVVIVDSLLPRQVAGKLDDISRAMEDYSQLKAFKTPIKGTYVVLFLAVTLLVVFSATWFGFYIARSITGPMQKLLDGTRAVAAGNLAVHVEAESTDELKELVNSFNTMTNDLRLSKASLEAVNQSLRHSNVELEQRRAYIETVLETIATGVMATGPDGRVTTFNRSAEMILQSSAEAVKGRHYEDVFKSFGIESLAEDLRRLIAQNGDTIERELAAEVRGLMLTLRFSIALLRGHERQFMGAVLVFDDLSELLKAQKLAAWQEVARRIAHEIKNPLTPILLATERLRKRFVQPADDFPTVFDESTRTIISEVNTLKTMVDEFSNFARMPAPSPHPCDLHALLQEVVALYRSAHKDVDITTQFADGLPPLLLDPSQIKRVFINLFENAVAAMNGHGGLRVSTRYVPGQPIVQVRVDDEGVGIPPEDLDKLFLPYFSKRRGGTGLGLAIVHQIITDHNGQISARPNRPHGTTLTITLPVPSAP
ncbi:MAG: HAMP domain-containing protein [Nitrospirae bacterium]|nr:HAMP domain-containing protein [Nitrospirota bacterium]